MISKGKKLNAEDLKKLKYKGKRVHTTLFSVVYMPENELKFSVSVTKKLYKKAVDRNRAKRRVFAAISLIKPGKTGWYDFMVKSPLNTLAFEEIRSEIEKICQK